MPNEAKQVYAAITKVMDGLAAEGVAKKGKNVQQGYAFRGIDQMYDALARKLADAKLLIAPRVATHTQTERTTKAGGSLFYTVVQVDYDFISSIDGSMHTVRFIGEAMDSADKSTNKAMSAAYKYCVMQTFCIPLEGQPDADAETPEPSKHKVPEPGNVQAPKAPIANTSPKVQSKASAAVEPPPAELPSNVHKLPVPEKLPLKASDGYIVKGLRGAMWASFTEIQLASYIAYYQKCLDDGGTTNKKGVFVELNDFHRRGCMLTKRAAEQELEARAGMESDPAEQQQAEGVS